MFEHAARMYTRDRGYWLHAVFLGRLWASGRLRAGGDVACGFNRQLKRDVESPLPKGTVCDAATTVEFVRGKGWDVSISVTDPNKSRPVLHVVEGLPGTAGGGHRQNGESATWVRHQPARWKEEQSYVVVLVLPSLRSNPADLKGRIWASRGISGGEAT